MSVPTGNSGQPPPDIQMLLPVNVVDPPGLIVASETAGNNVRDAIESAEERTLMRVEVEKESTLKRSDWVGPPSQPVAVIEKLENRVPS